MNEKSFLTDEFLQPVNEFFFVCFSKIYKIYATLIQNSRYFCISKIQFISFIQQVVRFFYNNGFAFFVDVVICFIVHHRTECNISLAPAITDTYNDPDQYKHSNDDQKWEPFITGRFLFVSLFLCCIVKLLPGLNRKAVIVKDHIFILAKSYAKGILRH